MTHFRSVAGTLIAAAALASHANAQGNCKRPAARQFKQGETVVLAETKTFPCKIEFANTPVALRANANAAITNLAGQVARGPDGSFYTSASKGAEIHVWTPTGQFKRALGTEGSGPGEFKKGFKSFAFTRDGRVIVTDGMNRRWTVLSPALAFERSISNASGIGEGFLADDGFYVSGSGSVERTGSGFGIYDFSANPQGQPRLVREFGAVILRTPRIIAPSTGLNFWAAPRDGPGVAFELELWRTDGTLLHTLRRDVPWFPKSAGEEPRPEVEVLSDDGTGIAFVSLMIPNTAKFVSAGKEPDPAKRHALQDAAVDIYFEAIDGNAGVVLASWGPFHPSVAMKTLPTGFIPRTRMGYRFETDADGLDVARIVEVRLVAN